MKIKNAQLDPIVNSITKLNESGDMPVKVAYGFAMIVKELEGFLKPVSEAKMAALKEFGGGKSGVSPKDEEYEAVMKAIQPILNEEVEVNIRKIPYEDFCSITRGVNLYDVAPLLPLIEDPEE